MKRLLRTAVPAVILPFAILLLLGQGCKKADDTTNNTTPSGDLMLKGRVVSSLTHAGIANATVLFGASLKLTTDGNGWYQVNCKTAGNGTHDVRVTAGGFGYGYASATITASSSMINTIVLQPLSDPVQVGQNGGVVTTTDPESLLPGTPVTLGIPTGAFAGPVDITLTRITGIGVPGYAPAGFLNASALILGTAGNTPSKELILAFPLPFAVVSSSTLPLLKYDFTAGTWSATGLQAEVNPGSGTATVHLLTPGTYSLGVPGSFTESNGAGSATGTMALDPSKSSVDLTYLGQNNYPGGVPATISTTYLQNVASQNTRINGTRISFTDSTTVTFTYIGSKPDSLAGTKSTLTGYYKWIPKVGYATQTMPMSATIHGTTVTGVILKEVYSDACGWQYVHDQGGGGK